MNQLNLYDTIIDSFGSNKNKVTMIIPVANTMVYDDDLDDMVDVNLVSFIHL